jgi:hypothetical protein
VAFAAESYLFGHAFLKTIRKKKKKKTLGKTHSNGSVRPTLSIVMENVGNSTFARTKIVKFRIPTISTKSSSVSGGSTGHQAFNKQNPVMTSHSPVVIPFRVERLLEKAKKKKKKKQKAKMTKAVSRLPGFATILT